MTPRAYNLLLALMSNVWRLFTSFKIPGTAVTPATFFVGSLVIWQVWLFLKRVLGNESADTSSSDLGGDYNVRSHRQR